MPRWEAELIAARFEESVETLYKLPKGQHLGYANYWPEIKYERRELLRQALPGNRLLATPNQITRMEETFTWITWIEQDERKLVWARAYRTPWRLIARKTGVPKTSAQRYWQGALLKIAERLEQERSLAH